MKQKLLAGTELDILTGDELRTIAKDTLKAWRVELTRGAKLRRHVMAGDVVGGAVSFGDNQDGPAEGMAWAITRVTVAPGPTLGAGGLNLYVNSTDSLSTLLLANLTVGNLFPGDHGVNLLSGDSLRITGSGITVASQVVMTFGIREVPIQEVWSL